MNQVLYNVQFSHELFKSRPMNHGQNKISIHQNLILLHFSIQRCGVFLCHFLRPIFQARLNRNWPRFLWIYFYPCLYFHAELCDITNETLWPATRKLAPTQRDKRHCTRQADLTCHTFPPHTPLPSYVCLVLLLLFIMTVVLITYYYNDGLGSHNHALLQKRPHAPEIFTANVMCCFYLL